MKAICLNEPRKFTMIDREAPAAPGPGMALVRTHRMGICGTDYSGYLGKMPFFRYPRIPGHELGVEVLAVGDDVQGVEVGGEGIGPGSSGGIRLGGGRARTGGFGSLFG